jgi:predicted metal-binding membrane protein
VSIDASLEAVVRRDRLVVVIALIVVIALAWAYLLAGAGMGISAFEMTRISQLGMAKGMTSMAMMAPAVWTPGYAVLMFFMWLIMMVAMMLPSAARMILLFATVNGKQRETGHPQVATSIFTVGYLAAWAGFSSVAIMLQWTFERTGILSPMLVGTNVIFAGALLLAAGVYQLTPIKQACPCWPLVRLRYRCRFARLGRRDAGANVLTGECSYIYQVLSRSRSSGVKSRPINPN